MKGGVERQTDPGEVGRVSTAQPCKGGRIKLELVGHLHDG